MPGMFAAAMAGLILVPTACSTAMRRGDESLHPHAAPVAQGAAQPRLSTGLRCEAPDAPQPASGAGPVLEADTPGGDGTRMFPLSRSVPITITTRARGADTVVWRIVDEHNVLAATGRLAVSGAPQTVALRCRPDRAGYFAIQAGLERTRVSLPARGTRPAGIATFGVLPDLARVLPGVAFSHPDQHRFGGQGADYLRPGQRCCDGDGYRPLYTDLGLAWANDARGWHVMEPHADGTFVPGANTLAAYFRPGDIMRLIQLDGIPGWASPTRAATHSYAPTSEAAYRDYIGRVGRDAALIRSAYFPRARHNYYQVTWEPDPDGGLPWRDGDARFVALYRATYEAIHAVDPDAIVMGPTYAIVGTNTAWLNRLARLGLGRYLDGVTIHGYYDAGTSPSHPPERLATDRNPAVAANALPASMRALRRTMVDVVKRGAPLFVTETGIGYDAGTAYGPTYPTPNVLFAHGAVVARTQLILLGEGADMSFLFYSSDPPIDPPGFGLFFDLDHPRGTYGARSISPKPAAMAIAAMTRIIDGTETLGHLENVPDGIYGYVFRRLTGGRFVTALWTHENAVWNKTSGYSETYTVPYALAVDAPGTRGEVTVLDTMGNPTALRYANGRVNLELSESPLYVVSTNGAVLTAQVTPPAR